MTAIPIFGLYALSSAVYATEVLTVDGKSQEEASIGRASMMLCVMLLIFFFLLLGTLILCFHGYSPEVSDSGGAALRNQGT